jgi:hypothetical protein
MKDIKRVILSLTPKLVDKVDAYRDDKGLPNLQQAIIHMIIGSTDVPEYVKIEKEKLQARVSKVAETPEQRILRQEEESLLRKEMKAKAEENRGEKICLSMIGGKVTPDGYCEFPVWHERVGSVVEKRTRRIPTESMAADIPQHLSFLTAKPEAARKRVEEAMLLPENAGNPDLAL